MTEKMKLKKGKPLPAHIQHSVILWYFAVVIVFSFVGAIINDRIDNINPDINIFFARGCRTVDGLSGRMGGQIPVCRSIRR